MSSGPRYGAVAIGVHWLTLLLVAGLFAVGWYMHDLETSPLKLQLYSYHKWTGVTVFALTAMRLAWRFTVPPPPLPSTIPAWQRTAAHFSHGALYLLLFAIPVSGWLMSSAKGFQTVWFGVVPLPELLGKDEGLGELLEEVHEWLGRTLLGLVALHAAAAIKHHVLDRDDVMARMVPGLPTRERKP